MSSGCNQRKHGTPSSDEAGPKWNGGHRRHNSHPNEPTPKVIQDSRLTPKKPTRPPEPWNSPCDEYGNSLAQDLFGMGSSDQFEIHDYDPYSQGRSWTHEARPHNRDGPTSEKNEEATGHNHSSKVTQLISKPKDQKSAIGEIPSAKIGGCLKEASKQSKNSGKKSTGSERIVQYDPFDSEFANLKITVTQEKPKKKASKKFINETSNNEETSTKHFKNPLLTKIDDCKTSTPKADKSISHKNAHDESHTSKKLTVNHQDHSQKVKEIGKDRSQNTSFATENCAVQTSELKVERPALLQSDEKHDGCKKKKPPRKKKKKKKKKEVDCSLASEQGAAEKKGTSTDQRVEAVAKPEPDDVKKKNTVPTENSAPSKDQQADDKNIEKMGLEQAELRLEKDFIFKLTKKSASFPNAKYFCRACSHHLDSINIAHKHIKEKRHKKEVKPRQQSEVLRNFKLPPPNALDALSHHLDKVVDKEMLTASDTIERRMVVKKLENIINSKLEGLKKTGVNIEIEYEGEMKTPQVLLKILDVLKTCDELADAEENFDAKVPSIAVTDKASKLRCVVSLHNLRSIMTTRLLAFYMKLDKSIVKLSKLFRLWGCYCELDNQQHGSLPPHSFLLMTIYFLQQQYNLPVLHELMAEHDVDSILTESEGFGEILKVVDGDWWYFPTSSPIESETKVESPVEETTDQADSDSDPDIIFDRTEKREVAAAKERPLVPSKLKKCFSESPPSIGQLWIELLKFYAAQFDMENLIISVCSSDKVTRGERGWSHRRIAIEDPCSPKWNLCKAMTSQTKKSRKASIGPVDKMVSSILKSAFEELKSIKREEFSSSVVESTSENDLSYLINQVINDAVNEVHPNVEKNYEECYYFTKKSLMNGKIPVTICSTCKKEGHRKKSCPDEAAIVVKPLPEFTPNLRHMVDNVIKECFEVYHPKEEESRIREFVCQDILTFLRKYYDETIDLCLFGSSRNRFTFCQSDLDICLTFRGNATGEGLDFAEIIEELAKILRKHLALRQIIPITTAKVPIVKFYAPRAGLEGDISLYNLLAQRNTTMVALYATIDERCRILGYAIKTFVKRCGIGDASRGSLSSYAYILLVIYFLQQRDPPVLPVLQELFVGDEAPQIIVDGWNSWFYDDLGNLDKVWPEHGRNKESVGQLWLGMLRFYTEGFDFERRVIAIRQKKLLTSFEKEWTSKFICIEDPFDLSHNLGSGVSRKMTNFIRKVFVKARERFGTTPAQDFRRRHFNLHDYFFNLEFLTDGQEVPNDRCCRICGKIGHYIKDCPRRRTRKNKGNDDGRPKDVECFVCGKKGHVRKECPDAVRAKGAMFQERSPVPLPWSPVSYNQRVSRQKSSETPQKDLPVKKQQTQKVQNKMVTSSAMVPHPSSSPRDIGPGRNFARNLARSFESESGQYSESATQPSHFNRNQWPGCQGQSAKHYSLGDSPSPSTILTLEQVEAEMRQNMGQKNTDRRPNNLSRHQSHEPTASHSYPAFQDQKTPPRLHMQHSVPPSTPPRHQYMPPFSPQSHGHHFGPRRDVPRYHFSPSSGYPPYQGQHEGDQFTIPSLTFANSGLRRDVRFTPPNMNGYHSYPPGTSQTRNWQSPNK